MRPSSCTVSALSSTLLREYAEAHGFGDTYGRTRVATPHFVDEVPRYWAERATIRGQFVDEVPGVRAADGR